jgi:hypothetical protein
MAKQTFTTGQVLTAAQMTSLQQTAMLGGAASAKVASYTLVAADAGTAISMSNASATTITVNTGLFAAGDTVFIQNIGAGACTITAGTATVATAGSLILPQNDAGILYFTSTGAATFYDFIQAGAVSPLTTKGDLYGFSTSDARIPIGTNNQVLTADSAQPLGLKWATPAGGGKVLQVVGATTTTPTTIASLTFTDTTITATITPTSATSKILVLVQGYVFYTRASNSKGQGVSTKLLRGATSLTQINETDYLELTGVTTVDRFCIIPYMYYDSPATTSATTYKLQGAVSSTVNSGSSTWQSGNYLSSITLLEIGA